MYHLHANKSETAISKASQCMGPVNNVLNNKYQIYRSSFHSMMSSANDCDVIIKEIRLRKGTSI